MPQLTFAFPPLPDPVSADPPASAPAPRAHRGKAVRAVPTPEPPCHRTRRQPKSVPNLKTFADVDAFLQGYAAWQEATRASMRSNCRLAAWSVARNQARSEGYPAPVNPKEVDLATVPFDVAVINAAWEGQSFRQLGFNSEKSFRNTKWSIRRVAQEGGRIAPIRAPKDTRCGGFGPLVDAAKAYDQPRVRRFAGWCASQSLKPASINDAVLLDYGQYLRTNTLGTRVPDILRLIANLWRNLANSDPRWPQRAPVAPSKMERYSAPISAYPVAFQEDVDAFVDWMKGTEQKGPFGITGWRRAMRPTTIKCRRKAIRVAAWALVAGGTPIENVLDLDCLVSPKAVESILTWHWERAQAKHAANAGEGQPPLRTTPHLQSIATALGLIAEHYCKIAMGDLQQVKRLISMMHVPAQAKPTKKVRERLRQFDDLTVRQAVLRLPQTLMEEALALRNRPAGSDKERSNNLVDAAGLARKALFIGVLCRIPLRIGNLCGIRLGTNLLFAGARSDIVRLCFQPHETKNHVDLEFFVGVRLRALLATYIEHFLPVFADASADFGEYKWLFPSAGGRQGALSTGQARKLISRTIEEKTGAVVNPHLFRALAVKLALEHSPGALEQCRLLLGDKTLSVVMRHYAGMEEQDAARRQDKLIDAEEERLGSLPMGRKKRQRGSTS